MKKTTIEIKRKSLAWRTNTRWNVKRHIPLVSMAGFHGLFYSCSFVLLLVRVTQDFNTITVTSSIVDFRAVLLVSLRLSPLVVRSSINFLIFCNLLQLCGNISSNPSPPMVKYPCGKCSKAVAARQRGIECSRCRIWHHALCVSVSVAEYNALSDDVECPWYCPSCVVSISDSQPIDTSLASVMIEDNSLTSVTKENGYHCCVLNACSVVSKRFELFAYLIAHQFDIVAITETFLDSTIHDSRIVPPGYAVFHKVRDRHGGGVMIFVKACINAVRCCDLETDCELLWIELPGKQTC